MLYRAINTLDSLFGYRNEKYKRFGTVSARVDDLANYLPARLTAPWIALSSSLLGLYSWNSISVLLRDGRKHPSPNSGLSEAAVAGALGVQLGGINFYAGVQSPKPFLGVKKHNLKAEHISTTNLLILITCFLVSIFYLFVRRIIVGSF